LIRHGKRSPVGRIQKFLAWFLQFVIARRQSGPRHPAPLRHPDGAVTIVFGDVSGKGLRAAMTVAAIIGALRIMLSSSGFPVIRPQSPPCESNRLERRTLNARFPLSE